MATTHEHLLTYDEVLDRVLAADPESFYAQAMAFEQAADALDEAKRMLAKYRRQLEESWSDGVGERFVRLQILVGQLEALLDGLPAYPRLLRRTAETIVDSRRRLLALRHLPDKDHGTGLVERTGMIGKPDQKALSDRDAKARGILEELSTSYRQIGGEMPELPTHTVSGKLIVAPPPQAPAGGAVAPVALRSARKVSAQPVRSHSLMGRGGLVEPAAVQTVEETARPESQAAFGGFATLATRSAPVATGHKDQSFNGFAGLADPADSAAVPLAAQGKAPGVAKSTEDEKGESARNLVGPTHLPAGLDGRATQLPMTVPANLESARLTDQLPAAPPVTSVQPVTAALPVTSIQPQTATSQVTLAGNAVPVPTVATSSAPAVASVPAAAVTAAPAPAPAAAAAAAPASVPPPVAAAPAPPPGPPSPPAVPATSAPQASPFAMAANAGLTPAAGSAVNTARPPLGAALGAAPVAPMPMVRGSEVWLRADVSDWNQSHHHAMPRLGREGADQVLGLNVGGTCATEQGKEVR